jgi:alpha-D-xyloside xylohydrolase
VARGYVERGLPISTIVIDWKHWENQGDWQFNAACWPDPQGMVEELQTLGIEPMVTFWPFQTTPSIHWNEFNSSGYLVPLINGTLLPYDGDQYLVDMTNPYARQSAFNDGFVPGYFQYGFKTVWLDAAEPEHFGGDLEGQWRLMAGTDAEVGEAWVREHVKGFQEGFATKGIAPGDYFVLPRHAWVGSWKYSAALWSGDIESSFDELAIQIRDVQGALMSGIALWASDTGGYFGGDPADPQFQELIVRWFQFSAFCPLFRLHGHRDGGPPDNECGPTNGDNEVWNLATDPAHYTGIVNVMHARENLREYVSQINAVTAATGTPMLRPMFLQWPNDPACAGADVEDQFMFGPKWLVAPVYTYQATSRSVYLPLLDANHTWIYFYNFSSVGQGGGRITIATPIEEFPLFYIEPITPPPPIQFGNATNLWSAQRNDSVLCVVQDCFGANAPGDQGDYVQLRVEGQAILNDPEGTGQVTFNGTSYALVPLNLYFSFTHNDNLVTTNTSAAPDSSYSPSNGGVTFQNGYALATQAPGTLALQLWFRDYNGPDWDYLTILNTPESITWAQQNKYTFTGQIAGYIFPPAA